MSVDGNPAQPRPNAGATATTSPPPAPPAASAALDLEGLSTPERRFFKRVVDMKLSDSSALAPTVAELRKRRAAGEPATLPALTLEQRKLSGQQVRHVLLAIRMTTLACPNPACAKKHDLKTMLPRSIYPCPACGWTLQFDNFDPAEDAKGSNPTGKSAETSEPALSSNTRPAASNKLAPLPDAMSEQLGLATDDGDEGTLLDTSRLIAIDPDATEPVVKVTADQIRLAEEGSTRDDEIAEGEAVTDSNDFNHERGPAGLAASPELTPLIDDSADIASTPAESASPPASAPLQPVLAESATAETPSYTESRRQRANAKTQKLSESDVIVDPVGPSRRSKRTLAEMLVDDDLMAGRSGLIHAMRITRSVKAEFDLPLLAAPRPEVIDDPSLNRTASHLRYGYEGQLRWPPGHSRGEHETAFLVRDRDLRRPARMRVLRSTAEATNDEIERFAEEMQIVAQLEHPIVPPIYDFGIDAEQRVFVVERQPTASHTLATLFVLRSQPLNDPNLIGMPLPPPRPIPTASGRVSIPPRRSRPTTHELFDYLLRVADGLAYAHARGVLYRNLRPSNVLIGDFGDVYLVDWSRAGLRGRPETRDERLMIGDRQPDGRVTTQDGTLVVDPAFLPPEVAAGELELLDITADVYGLGALAYAICANEPPYLGTTAWDILSAVRTSKPLALSRHAVGKRTPKAVQLVIEQAMARKPADRHADASVFAADLRHALRAGGLTGHDEFPSGLWAMLRAWFI